MTPSELLADALARDVGMLKGTLGDFTDADMLFQGSATRSLPGIRPSRSRYRASRRSSPSRGAVRRG